MKKGDWEKIKESLGKFHPTTRLNWLRRLLNSVKDKKIIAEIEEEIKKTEVEIQEQRLWKRDGVFLKPGEAEEDQKTTMVAPSGTLEQVVETGIIGEEAEAVNYGLSGAGYKPYEESRRRERGRGISEELRREGVSYESRLDHEREHEEYVTTLEREESLIRSEEQLKKTEKYKKSGVV